MKSVLVTGAEGFIGSHLVQKLISKKIKVRAFVQYNSFNNWGWLEDLKSSEKKILIVTGVLLLTLGSLNYLHKHLCKKNIALPSN